jgi:hypothetical protein
MTAVAQVEEIITAKLSRKNEFGEYVVRCYVNGKRHEAGDYHTDDLKDAQATQRHMAFLGTLRTLLVGKRVCVVNVKHDLRNNDCEFVMVERIEGRAESAMIITSGSTFCGLNCHKTNIVCGSGGSYSRMILQEGEKQHTIQQRMFIPVENDLGDCDEWQYASEVF